MMTYRRVQNKDRGPVRSLRRIEILGVILAFAGLSLFINFFHTDTGHPGGSPCPACHFLNSSLTEGPALFFYSPHIVFVGFPETVEIVWTRDPFPALRLSRSPPPA